MQATPFLHPVVIVGFILILVLLNWIKVLKEYERGVVFRLGRVLEKPKGPGLIFVLSPIDKIVRISLRTIVLDVPPQDIITKDNVSVKVNAVVYFRVLDPTKAVVEVQGLSLCHVAIVPNHPEIRPGSGGTGRTSYPQETNSIPGFRRS